MFREIYLWLRRYVSPAFLVLFLASYMLWFIAKLNYTYTTDIAVKLNVDGAKFTVPCVVEGKGTNLFGYRFYASRRLNIPPEELLIVRTAPDSIHIEPLSLQTAIAIRLSDIKILSVEDVPDLHLPQP